jgi:predicted DNA-binding ribbon-helix-helix protein
VQDPYRRTRRRVQNLRFKNRVGVLILLERTFKDELTALARENRVTVSRLLNDLAHEYYQREAPARAVFQELSLW